jgi:hypothetical protein
MARLIPMIAAALSIGCGASPQPCFNTSSLILDTRPLAVRVDPPESIADLSGADSLTPSSISLLVVEAYYPDLREYGDAVRVTNYPTQVHVCLPPPVSEVNARPGCPSGSALVADLAKIPDESTPLVYTPPLSLLQSAVEADPVHGLAGIQLTLQFDISADIGTISIAKQLSYQVKGSLASVNHAIELVGLEVSSNGAHSVVATGEPAQIQVGTVTGLRPLIGPGAGAESAVETYFAYDNHGELVQLQEHVTYAFYGGDELFFGAPNSGGGAVYTGAAGDLADEPRPGVDPPDGIVTVEGLFPGDHGGWFWVVARDGRGGVAWMEMPYYATETRPCWDPILKQGRCPTLFFGCN